MGNFHCTGLCVRPLEELLVDRTNARGLMQFPQATKRIRDAVLASVW